jgi:hypothetical protein
VRLVILESPFAGDITLNKSYARACVRDCLLRGESPIASHLLFTQPEVLRDDIPDERKLGIAAGHAWYRVADACVVYVDRGISDGMQQGIEIAKAAGVPIDIRNVDWP